MTYNKNCDHERLLPVLGDQCNKSTLELLEMVTVPGHKKRPRRKPDVA